MPLLKPKECDTYKRNLANIAFNCVMQVMDDSDLLSPSLCDSQNEATGSAVPRMNESLFYGENVYFCCCLYEHDVGNLT